MAKYIVHVPVKLVYEEVEIEIESSDCDEYNERSLAAQMAVDGKGNVLRSYSEKYRHTGAFYVTKEGK